MPQITFDLPLQVRAASFASEIDEEKRQVRFSFSSDAPSLRKLGDGSDELIYEVLSHEREAVDTSRLDAKAVPFLDSHDWGKPIGKITDYGFQNGKGYAVAKLSRSAAGEQALNDIRDQIRTEISVGYFVKAMRPEGEYNGKRQFVATRWQPYEISLISVPQDYSVGVGRGASNVQPCTLEVAEERQVISQEIKPMAEPIATPAPKVEVIHDLDKLRELEFSRMRELRAVGDKFHVSEEADKYIRDGRSLAEFNQWVLETQFKSGDQIRTVDPYLGQKPVERKRYNLCKAILEKADGQLTGYEREMHLEMVKQTGRQAEGFLVPDFIWMGDGFRRDLTVTGAPGTGQELVQTIVEPSLVEYLRNVIVTARAGATVMTGLRDNIALPRQISTATSQWVAETAALTTSNPTFDQVLLKPNRIGATSQYSRQLLIQGVLDVNNIVRNDLFETIGHQIDYVAFNGSGVGPQPAGILNTPADTVWPSAYSKCSPAVPFSGSGYATWTQVVQFETNVAANNVHMESPSCHYVTSPKVKGQFKTLAKADPRSTSLYYPSFFWEPNDEINGYPALASNQISTNQVIFGRFDQLILAYWGGTDIVVDPYTAAKSGEIIITMNLFVDVALRHSPSFCYSTTAPYGIP
jgi:HK97 family phage major capsid protein